jgi:hypothetical protein
MARRWPSSSTARSILREPAFRCGMTRSSARTRCLMTSCSNTNCRRCSLSSRILISNSGSWARSIRRRKPGDPHNELARLTAVEEGEDAFARTPQLAVEGRRFTLLLCRPDLFPSPKARDTAWRRHVHRISRVQRRSARSSGPGSLGPRSRRRSRRARTMPQDR